MIIHSAKFIKSASKLTECPPAEYPEITVIGRSNVGKSSLINMLTGNNKLAKASDTPGKTQLINYFLINEQQNPRYLVDLPGYGYAKSGRASRIAWMDMIQEYLVQRKTLQKILVLIDGSISPQQIDNDFIATLDQEQLPFAIVITKTDKIKQSELHKNLKAITNNLKAITNNLQKITHHTGMMPGIMMTSSLKGRGKNEILVYIQSLLAGC